MVDSATEVGRIIGGIARQQSNLQENISPDEADAQLSTLNTEELKLPGVLTVTKRTIVGIMVVGHPTYGVVGGFPIFVPFILGHSTWGVLGEGYLPILTSTLAFPLTFPWTFEDAYATYDRTELFTINF